MGRIVVMEWMALDGVDDAHSMDAWFMPFHSDARAEYISGTIKAVDKLLLGRKTYQMLAPFWSSRTTDEMGSASKLNNMPKHVVSSTLDEPVWANTEGIIEADVSNRVADLKAATEGDILIIGRGTLVRTLAEAGLGTGARFYADGLQSPPLELKGKDSLDLGVVLLRNQPKSGPTTG